MLANPYQPWVTKGYTSDILPIIPPGAALSPYSKLTSEKIGKLPGYPTIDGAVGFAKWSEFHTTTADIARWVKDANGLIYSVALNARTIHAFDVDTKDPVFARAVFNIMRVKIPDVLDSMGIRIGRAPGFLVPFRPETPHRKGRIAFEKDGQKSAVEMLGVGQQYVVAGQHPSGKPYTWRKIGKTVLGDHDLSAIVTIPDARLIDFWQTVQGELPKGAYSLYKPSRTRLHSGDQGSEASPDRLLAPSIEDVALALESLPNRPGDKRDRTEWIDFLHAIAGATGKSAEGRALWCDWSLQWSEDGGHVAATESRWDSLGPVHIGWAWLEDKAHADSAFGLASARNVFAEAEHLNGVAALDGGLFDKPRKDHPTAEDLDAAIAAMEPGDMNAVDAIIKMLANSRMTNARRENYLRTLKKMTKLGIGVLREQMNNDIRNLQNNEDVGIRLAEIAVRRFGPGMLAFYQHRFWVFDGATWAKIDDTIIRADMTKAIKADDRLLMTPRGQPGHADSMIRAGISILKGTTCDVLANLDNSDFIINRVAINLRNGTLWLKPNGRHELRPHNPVDCFTYKLDIDYDPLATGTLYDRTLADMQSRSYYTLTAKDEGWSAIKEQVDRANASARNPVTVPDGRLAWRVSKSYRVVDLKENCRLINEILGYSLIPQRVARCLTIFKGNGANGKTALVNAVASRMRSMVISTSIENLRSRFAWGELRDKLLLLIDEGTQTEVPDDLLKTISENVTITVDVKGRDFITFKTTAFTIINTNRHFYTSDNSDGMRSRLIFVPFNKQYSPDDRLNNPWPRLVESDQEMSAAFNRWIDGLSDVLARSYIQETRASRELFAKWQQTNTPEAAFVAECCTMQQPRESKADGAGLDELHPSYQGWFAQQHGSVRQARGRNRFADVLEQLGYERYDANGRVRFRGLWLKANLGTVGSAGFDFQPLTKEEPGED